MVPPGHTQRFELKYGFSLLGGVQYDDGWTSEGRRSFMHVAVTH